MIQSGSKVQCRICFLLTIVGQGVTLGILQLKGRSFNARRVKKSWYCVKSRKDKKFNNVTNEILKVVIEVYPEIVLRAFNSYLKNKVFFQGWKKQKLILKRKEGKPVNKMSFIRPICQLHTMEKLLELFLKRHDIRKLLYDLRKGRTTIDGIINRCYQ